MELMSGLTDDQTALAGCVIALVVCGVVMTLSSFVGRARQTGNSARPLRLVDGVETKASAARAPAPSEPVRRRAA
jgi:hypothetical protein